MVASTKIAIIDYGMGNLRSVQKAFEAVGHAAEVTADPDRVAHADRVVLPGVGAFADAMTALTRTGLGQAFTDAVRAGRPCLGVCLGLQLLFECSEEDGEHPGLALLPGRVVRFRPPAGSSIKVPHMGWNSLDIKSPLRLFDRLPTQPSVYFVHSYYAAPSRPENIAATTDYAGSFASVVAQENLVACQFHPEKSQKIGLAMYANFAKLG